MPRNCKRNVPTVKKKEKLKWVLVIGRLKFQGQLIARNEALLCFFLTKYIQRMAMVNGVLISRPIVRKRSFVVLLFVFNSQNEVYL